MASFSYNHMRPEREGNNVESVLSSIRELPSLVPPDSFAFPFKPYDIQVDFMRKLYETLSEGKIGIFESPTGTGKSMSIICASLKWLSDFESLKRNELESAINETKESRDKLESHMTNLENWFEQFLQKKEISDRLMKLKTEFERFQKLDDKLQKMKGERCKKEIVMKKDSVEQLYSEFKEVKQALEVEIGVKSLDEECVLKEYVSDDELSKSSSDESDDEVNDCITKIYFCSRTHSQLGQFANEVKKSPFGSNVRLVTLGSRQTYCINNAVKKFKHANAINDRCRELQKHKAKESKLSVDGEVLKKKKTTCGCSFYRQGNIESLRNKVLVNIRDIEDLAILGHKMNACPYYATRYAQPFAEIVLLPYNTLLHKQTREASGIVLKDNIVIIDEAHNLLDAISSIHSSKVSGAQLSGALSQLSQYKERYSARLKAKNVYYIQQIISLLKSILKFLSGLNRRCSTETSTHDAVKICTLNEFILETAIDNINLFKILHYCKKSEISLKLLGFSTVCQPSATKANGISERRSSVADFLSKLTNGNASCNPTAITAFKVLGTESEKHVSCSPLMQIEEFLRCLTNDDQCGRVLVNRQSTLENSYFKYYLLNPAAHFKDIISEARAIVVAGGTMQPVNEFVDQLFLAAGALENRITYFSCGHVIPASNLLAIALSEGPSGRVLDFSYQNRASPELIAELGRILANLCNVVPGGIVCFFPSYDYQSKVLSSWKTGAILQNIDSKKKVFWEAREAADTNKVFLDYSKHVLSKEGDGKERKGAILFSVVGGRMSEGINFNDDLGRCVVMIGMPYSNINSPELQEKMKYLNMTNIKEDHRYSGQAYYENLCMKAVNQSIGRAIRHEKDYATIVLLDSRYSKASVQKSLPGWIKASIQSCQKFGQAFGSLCKFFADKKVR